VDLPTLGKDLKQGIRIERALKRSLGDGDVERGQVNARDMVGEIRWRERPVVGDSLHPFLRNHHGREWKQRITKGSIVAGSTKALEEFLIALP
jgi:hypothetical protein